MIWRYPFISIFLFILLLLFFSGCKKIPVIKEGTYFLVKSESPPGSAPGSDLFVYDSLGRLTGYISGQLYIYRPGMILGMYKGLVVDTFFLNSQGLVSQDKGPNEFYVYNTDGYMVQYYQPSPTELFTVVLTISGGNLLSKVRKDSTFNDGHIICDTSLYTYYSDYETRNFGKAAWGRSNRNLMKTETLLSQWASMHGYSYDDYGRIITETTSTEDVKNNFLGTGSITFGY